MQIYTIQNYIYYIQKLALQIGITYKHHNYLSVDPKNYSSLKIILKKP